MTISYTVTEVKEFKFEPKDIVAKAIEYGHNFGYSIAPEDIYNDIYDNIDRYLEDLGLPDNAYDEEGIPDCIAEEIMKEVEKYIDFNSEEL